jgi:hypothetical protein
MTARAMIASRSTRVRVVRSMVSLRDSSVVDSEGALVIRGRSDHRT